MKVRGASYTPRELVAKLRGMPPQAYLRNARYLAATPIRRIGVQAMRQVGRPVLLPRLLDRRDRAELLAWARSASWTVPPLGRIRDALLAGCPGIREDAAERAKRALAHEFDLLGSGSQTLDGEIDWLCDFKTGHRWPAAYYRSIDYANLDQPGDVKVAWELSRCHQLLDLARAHLIDPDPAYPAEIAAQLRSWEASNPVGQSVNWSCTMEVAIRAVNWVYTLGIVAAELDDETLYRTVASLVQHGLFIARNLEVSEVAGNHYVSDALGLVVLGAAFRHSRLGRRWLHQGRAILAEEIAKQVYDDGVDHEMSIPYHRLVAEIFLIGGVVLQASDSDPGAGYWARLERMMEFVAAYTRPDGTVPIWGDADDGRVLPFGGRHLDDHRHLLSTAAVLLDRSDFATTAGMLWEDSIWLLGPIEPWSHPPAPGSREPGCVAFPHGGFAILRAQRWHVLFDAGPVGLRGRGGHGHNDALAVEVWASGGPLLVDPGCLAYTGDPAARNAFRSSRAHNAPVLGGRESNEVKGLWQLGDDAHAQLIDWDDAPGAASVTGRHVGYTRFEPSATVVRTVSISERSCTIRDRVPAALGDWTVRWTLAPGVEIVDSSATGAVLRRGEVEFRLSLRGASLRSVDRTLVAPSYGVSVEARCLDVSLIEDESALVIDA